MSLKGMLRRMKEMVKTVKGGGSAQVGGSVFLR